MDISFGWIEIYKSVEELEGLEITLIVGLVKADVSENDAEESNFDLVEEGEDFLGADENLGFFEDLGGDFFEWLVLVDAEDV